MYGDWVRPDTSPWRPSAETGGYRLIQVTRLIQGKSMVDQRITIDAVEIVHQNVARTICIVTNDTDFVPLLHYLREHHILTILIGDHRAPEGLRNAAHSFHELPSTTSTLVLTSTLTSVSEPKVPTLDSIEAELEAAYDETERNGMAHLGALGAALKKRMPKFTPKDYGEKRLLDLFAKFPDRFSVLSEERGEHAPIHYVRRRQA